MRTIRNGAARIISHLVNAQVSSGAELETLDEFGHSLLDAGAYQGGPRHESALSPLSAACCLPAACCCSLPLPGYALGSVPVLPKPSVEKRSSLRVSLCADTARLGPLAVFLAKGLDSMVRSP